MATSICLNTNHSVLENLEVTSINESTVQKENIHNSSGSSENRTQMIYANGEISKFPTTTTTTTTKKAIIISNNSSNSPSSSSISNSSSTSFSSEYGKVLKEDSFECISRSHDLYRLTLTSTHLLLQLVQSPYTVDKLSLDDLFGCHTFRHKDCSTNVGAYICFFFYIKRKKGLFSTSIKFPTSSSNFSLNNNNNYHNNKTNKVADSSSSSTSSTSSSLSSSSQSHNSSKSKYFREKTPLVFHIKKLGLKFHENLHIATEWKDSTLRILQARFSNWQLNKFMRTSLTSNGNTINENNHKTIPKGEYEEDADADDDDSPNGNNNKNSDRRHRRHGFPFTPTKLPLYNSDKRMSIDNQYSKDGDTQKNSTSYSNGQNDNELDELSIAITSYRALQRKFLIILNPKSGQGKTMQLFQEKVHPILVEGGIKVMLLITERPGHARSMLSSADLSDIDGIATLGGDGLLYEVVNGLRSRADSNKYADIPLGIIPGGSGNGLARSIASYSGEDQDYLHNPVVESTLAIAKGKVIPVNLAEVELDGRKIYSFLSVGWGLLSDIDIESEVLRGIGEIRFFLWSFLRLARLRTYSAELSYIPYDTSATSVQSPKASKTNSTTSAFNTNNYAVTGPLSNNAASNDKVETIEGNFISVYAVVQSYIGSDLIFAPNAKPNDGIIHLTFVRGNAGRTRTTQFLLGLDKGEHLDVSGVDYVPVKEFSLRCVGGIEGTVTIDGERVIGEHLKARISPKPLNIFSL